ncbi:SPOR domain-containing protein [Halobacillus fulvus]|nr:SPOR domain-containing protein [Halobacillus fulvus]
MEPKNKISISFRKEESAKSKQEQAAATESKLGQVIEHKAKKHPLKMVYKKERSEPVWKPVLMTLLTALVISFGLGFILLRMFVGLTDDASNGSLATSAPAASTGQPVYGQDSQSTALEAYVIQAGVFSTKEKVEEWKLKLTALSIPSVSWYRDDRYFLFAGSALTKAEADQIAANLADQNVETYVKLWQVKIENKSEGESQVRETILAHLENGTLNQLTEVDRQQLIGDVSRTESPLLDALKSWNTSDDSNVNWLETAKAMEASNKN